MSTPARFPRPTCVGYCRVSTVEQAEHGWSIPQQEDAIRARAEHEGLTVLAVFRDEGRSGRNMHGRAGLLALLELVAQGGVGVVLAKAQDRLARAVDHALGLRQWLHRHGTDLFFLDGDMHLRADDAMGGADLGADLLASLTAILAEEEIATLRRRILPNLVAAARRGRRGGRVPLGYRRQADGTVVVDPHDAGLVAQAVQAVLGGTGASQLSRQWVATGVRDSADRCISFDRLRGALTNPYLTGEMLYRVPVEVVAPGTPSEIRIPAHHPALIDPVTFASLQLRLGCPSSARTPAARMERRRIQRRSCRLPSDGDLLGALRPPTRPAHGAVPPDVLRCGTCGAALYASLMTVGGRGRRSRRAVYICRLHKDNGAAFCAQPPVPVEIVDDAVFTAVQAQLRDATLATGSAGPTPPAAAELTTAEAERDRLQAMVERLGTRATAALRERLATAVEAAQRLATRAQPLGGAIGTVAGPSVRFRQQPQATWEALDAAGRRAVLAPLLARVVVRGKAVAAVVVRRPDGSTVTVERPGAGAGGP